MGNRIAIIGRSGAGLVTITPNGSQTIEGKSALKLVRAGEVVALIEEGAYSVNPDLVTLGTIAPGNASWDADVNANDQALAAWINQNFGRAARRAVSASDTFGEDDQFLLFTGGGAQVASLPSIASTNNWRVLWHYGKEHPLVSDVATASPSGTGEETVKSQTVPGDWMDRSGQGFLARAIVKTANNANNKTARFTYGATELITSGAIALNDGRIILEARVWRTGATAQRSEGRAWSNDTGVLGFKPQLAAPAETLSGDVTLALKITCPIVASDATVELFEVLPMNAF